MPTIKNWTIRDIEALTDAEAWYMANGDCEEIKEHDIYFVDFPGGFGYSCVVFKDGHHIYFANDYELHHPNRTHEWLRRWYIDCLNNKLFTEDELSEPVTDYDEYKRKEYFLHSYYGMRQDYISMFHISRNEEEAEEYQKKTAGKIFNPVGFGYFDDEEFVKHHVQLFQTLQKARLNTMENYAYQKDAFKREMANHEYYINWQADYDTLSAFGNIRYHGDEKGELQKYFDELDFSDLRRRAYLDARKEYFSSLGEDAW